MKYVSILIFSIFLLVAFNTHANGFGSTLDKVVGEYTANVDYSAMDGAFVAGYPVQFAFQLFSKDRTKQLEFTDVWVTIAPSRTDGIYRPPIFDTGIISTATTTAGMLYEFPAGGSYDLTVRYNKEGQKVTQATFPLSVVGKVGGSSSKGILIGAGVVFVLDMFARLLAWYFKRRQTKI